MVCCRHFYAWWKACVICCLINGFRCANEFQLFQNVIELSGHDCGLSERVFSSSPFELLECACLCAQTWNCQGIFYSGISHTCRGCKKVYTVSDEATLPDGNLAFAADSFYFAYPRQNIFGDSRYMITVTEQSYEDGVELCASLGGFPVAIETAEENTYVQSLARNISAGKVCIGLHQPGGAGTDWIWESTGSVMGFNGFAHDEPNNVLTEHCAAMFAPKSYEWVDLVCPTPMPMVCEFPL